MTEIILVRHGQTAWNVGEIFRGQSDVDLDETGLKQAELLAGFLQNRHVEAVYSSPLQRALKTARAVASRHRLEAVVSPGLNDMSFGVWEGKPMAGVRRDYGQLYADWVANPHLVTIPGGDSMETVRSRALLAVQDIAESHERTVVLVTHRVVLKVVVLALLGLDNSRFWNVEFSAASMTTFRYQNDRWVLMEANNTCYLAPLQNPRGKDF